MVHAKKGTLRTTFSDMIWKNMGKKKNGWSEIDPADPNAEKGANEVAAKSAELNSTNPEYDTLKDRAAGFQTDGLFQEALDLYLKAQAIKDSSWIKGKINTLNAMIEAEAADDQKNAQFNELVEAADAAFADEDYDTALETYLSAEEIQSTKHITERIAASREAME